MGGGGLSDNERMILIKINNNNMFPNIMGGDRLSQNSNPMC